MSIEEQNSTAVVEGTAPENAATETQQAVQTAPEPQETTTTQVESGSKEPQVQERTRPRPSDHYRERQTIRELKDTVALLRKKQEELELGIKKPESVIPDVPDYDPAHFSPEHKRILAAREKALRDSYDAKISALEQKFNSWEETKANDENQRQQQEALEKLFPKTSADSKESLQERIARNPERATRIQEILLESGLNELSKTYPDKAAKYVLMELGATPDRPANPTVLKKGLMGAAQTGNPSMGTKRGVNESDLLAEKKKLNDQLDTTPSLRFDEKFMERRAQILKDIEALVTKK